MPIQTGFGNMTTGKDVSIDIVLASGQTISLGNVTRFDRKPKTKAITSDGIDGVPRQGVIPGGWDLNIEVDREDNIPDVWWAEYERKYYAGETVRNVTIHETIREGDGSISQYRYEGVALSPDDMGDFQADKNVKMRFKGMASFRKRVV